jgi:5,10-methenyltetrahydromethanopterin hydrogenase
MSPLAENAVMSWADIGATLGISKKVAQKIGERALRKLKAALEREGIDRSTFLAYMHLKDSTDAIHYENLAAIIPPGELSLDASDPKPWTKLRNG